LSIEFLEEIGVGARGNAGGAIRNWWRMVEWPLFPTPARSSMKLGSEKKLSWLCKNLSRLLLGRGCTPRTKFCFTKKVVKKKQNKKWTLQERRKMQYLMLHSHSSQCNKGW
jgi:hypothetical protein